MRFSWRCEKDLGGTSAVLRVILGGCWPLGSPWEHFGSPWGRFGSSWAHLVASLARFGDSAELVGALWRFMDALWGPCGGSWGHFGGSWGRSWRTLGALGHALVASRDTGGTFQIMFGRSV